MFVSFFTSHRQTFQFIHEQITLSLGNKNHVRRFCNNKNNRYTQWQQLQQQQQQHQQPKWPQQHQEKQQDDTISKYIRVRHC